MSARAYDYQVRANEHRPRKSWLIGAAVRRMAKQGLTERDIGAALSLDPTAVRSALTHAYNASYTSEDEDEGGAK